MSLFDLPIWVPKKFDKYKHSFFFFFLDRCFIWKNVYMPREEGGLGVKDLSCFYDSLLAQWGWHVIFDDKCLWRSHIEFADYKKFKLSCSWKPLRRYSNFGNRWSKSCLYSRIISNIKLRVTIKPHFRKVPSYWMPSWCMSFWMCMLVAQKNWGHWIFNWKN